MPTVKIEERACVGCGICVESCMMDVIRMKRGKAQPAYPEDCQACFLCEMDCPREAIEVWPASQDAIAGPDR